MNNVTKRNIITSLLWKLIEHGGAQGIQIIVQIILARILSPEEFGIIAIVIVFVNIAQVFVQGGFNVALVQKKDADNLDFSSIFFLSLIIASTFYVILFLLAPIVSIFYYKPLLTPLLRTIGIVLFIGALNSVQYAYVSKKMLFKKSAVSSLIATFVSGFVGIFSAFFGLGVWSLVIQQLTYHSVNCTILWFTIKWRPIRAFSLARIKSLFSYGSKILISSLIYSLYQELRTLIIGKVHTVGALGFYQRGEQVPRVIVNNIDGAIQSVILPSLSAHQDNIPKVKNMVRRSLKTSSYILFPMMFGIAATSKTIVYLLLGEQWLPTYPFLVIFSISYSLWPIITINQQSVRALGRSDIILNTEIYKRIIGFLIIIITVPINVTAVAYGFFIERVIEIFINAYPNKKMINYGISQQFMDVVVSFIQALLMGVIVASMNLLNINLLLRLFLQIIVGVFIYFSLSILLKNESLKYLVSTIKDLKK